MIIIYEKINKPTKKNGNHLKRKTNNLICNLYTMEKPSHKTPQPILHYHSKNERKLIENCNQQRNWKCLCGLGIC